MARIYSLEEIKAIHTRAQSKIDKIYKTSDKTFKGVAYGKLIDITDEQDIIQNVTDIDVNENNIEVNTQEIDDNRDEIEDNLDLIELNATNIASNDVDITNLQETKADKCYALAISIALG